MARKSTLGESTILRGPLGSHKLTEIFRVAFFSDRTMYYMVTAVELDTNTRCVSIASGWIYRAKMETRVGD